MDDVTTMVLAGRAAEGVRVPLIKTGKTPLGSYMRICTAEEERRFEKTHVHK
jgi:hypothetical protein